ncbi:arylsulfatase [Pseudomaricurvus alkylphenolicus]|uniref:arylsulfatase n=1 Tax=Pseudomaricurvus alkylphenolicus TaxID=1306991 RepID=UPI001422ECC5|nr:arylsulfatase [Pseudomaricurvus alkylphenolicus]NIB43494.1 arylsulfatase [Pseudomaricurvus alkylphenolicus]
MSSGMTFSHFHFRVLLGLQLLLLTSWVQARDVPSERPNILLIVADDMAYTDIGAFGGGDIQTPNLDELANRGMVFSRFYAGASCSTTRSMLLTSVDNHRAGLGTMVGAYARPAPNQEGQPGYEGHLRDDVVTVASLLQASGYHTYMTGKWHLGASAHNRPSRRGFDKTFAIQQNSDYFDDQIGSFGFGKRDYWRDGQVVEQLPENFYQTRAFADEMIQYIDSHKDDGQPFFGYLAFTAPHYPLQAPEDIIDSYQGRYDEGYDVLRQKRGQALLQSGLIGAAASYSAERADVQPWESLTQQEQAVSARAMEIYAAMVDEMDRNIGKVLAYLKHNNLYDNTLVVFLSDNGAEGASATRGHAPALLPLARNIDNRLQNMGRRGSVVLYSHTWATAGQGVFRDYKFSGAEGGVRVPAIISWPAAGLKPGISHAITSVLDFLPTVAELADVQHPAHGQQDSPYQAPEGKSLLPLLSGAVDAVRSEHDYLGFELWSGRGVVAGDWKLTGGYNQDLGQIEPWQLFNLAQDPGEQHDLSDQEPAVFQRMLGYWLDYVERNGVVIAAPDVPALRKPAVSVSSRHP